MESQTSSDSDKRGAQRLRLGIPIQGKVGDGERLTLEIVDISASGMQIRSEDFEAIREGFDARHNLATFEIRIAARLAWARPQEDGSFVTGWEFGRDDQETRIG